MATRKIFAVTDLGPGDGGKGGVVHAIACATKPHTVIKIGGAQGSHGVRTHSGSSFNFSQFGCGTLEGVRTHIPGTFVADPNALLNEGDLLRTNHGFHDPYQLLTVDEDALCVTPFHGSISRLAELIRKERRRGTIGSGVGVAYAFAERHPDLAIRMRDINSPGLRDKIEALRRMLCEESLLELSADVLPGDRSEAARERLRMRDPNLSTWTRERFREMAKVVRIVPRGYLGESILSQEGIAVVESSHGVLTDNEYGFFPHTSKLRTLPCYAQEMLRASGFSGEFVRLGVSRAYQIRHGAGPLVTEDPSWLPRLLPGSHKTENRYQGRCRVGPLDFVMLRYAIEVCGGPSAFDGIALSWFDQSIVFKEWKFCARYENATDPELFRSAREIEVMRPSDYASGRYSGHFTHRARQELLAQRLAGCKPVLDSVLLSGTEATSDYVELCNAILKRELQVPLRLLSLGPTERDKVLV